MAVHKVPFGLLPPSGSGPDPAAGDGGEGEFVGADAYSQFGQLASVFYDSGPGLLVHPLWQAASAYFVALRLEREPRPDYVRYSFTFWEGCEAITAGRCGPSRQPRRPPPVVPAWAAATIWSGRGTPSGPSPGSMACLWRSWPPKPADPEPESDPGGREGADHLTGYVITARG